MGAIDHLGQGHEADRQVRRQERVERAAPIGFSSVSRGALRITSDEGLIVEGSARVSGQLIVTGTETVTGTLVVDGETVLNGESEINGNMDVNGTMNVDGPLGVNGLTYLRGATEITGNTTIIGETFFTGESEFNGNMDVNGTLNIDGPLGVNGLTYLRGNTEITGTTKLAKDLTIQTGGTIRAGNMYINPDGTINSSGILYISGLNGTQVSSTLKVGGNLEVSGDETVLGVKSFGMEHPTKPGIMLRHASTESDRSGVEYWGDEVIGADGETEVFVPDYFNALAKEFGRTVLVTGRGFVADWTDVDGDRFTVYGAPGKRFSWLVKAERFGGDFPVESPMPIPLVDPAAEDQTSNSGQ